MSDTRNPGILCPKPNTSNLRPTTRHLASALALCLGLAGTALAANSQTPVQGQENRTLLSDSFSDSFSDSLPDSAPVPAQAARQSKTQPGLADGDFSELSERHARRTHRRSAKGGTESGSETGVVSNKQGGRCQCICPNTSIPVGGQFFIVPVPSTLRCSSLVGTPCTTMFGASAFSQCRPHP